MKPLIQSTIALCALIGTIAGAMTYFATSEELEAVAMNVQQNTDQMNYQSALRQYEFLLQLQEKNPDDLKLARKVLEAEKRIRFFECRLFQQGCDS